MTRLLAAALALLAYTFVGYPALIAAAARLRPRPVRLDPGYTPKLTVVVAAYNEEDVIEGKLADLLAQRYPRELAEIVVAADGSDDATAELAAAVDGVTVLHRPERRGKMAALNRAAAAATGEVLVFTDANNRFAPGTLAALAARFADPSVGVVTGRKAITDEDGRPLDRAEGLYWRYEARIKEWESIVGSTLGVSGEILAVRREAFRRAPEDAVVDDFEVALQAAADGWRIAYAPDAVSLEAASATVDDEVERRSRVAAGLYQVLVRRLPALARRQPVLAWQLVSHKGLRPLVPFMLVAAGAANASAFSRSRATVASGVAQLAFYAAAAAGWLRSRRDPDDRSAVFYPYYFVRMNGVALHGLVRYVRRAESGAWKRVRRR